MKKARIVAAIAAASTVVLLAASPVLAVDVIVAGNGSSSDNTANVTVTQSKLISQTNQANISNTVDANATTGQNSANSNTGGDTSIKTGDASTAVNLNNNANSNKSSVGCCSDPISTSVSISGNGADSKNKVNFAINNTSGVTNQNTLNINNHVNAGANTGDNEANKNTGGNTSITTGDANVSVTIGNSGNSNEAVVCGCLLASIVNPPTPTVTPIANPLPGVATVLGLTSKSLPNTGFDYPYQLIFGVTAGLISLGLVMKLKASEIEEVLGSISGKVKLG